MPSNLQKGPMKYPSRRPAKCSWLKCFEEDSSSSSNNNNNYYYYSSSPATATATATATADHQSPLTNNHFPLTIK